MPPVNEESSSDQQRLMKELMDYHRKLILTRLEKINDSSSSGYGSYQSGYTTSESLEFYADLRFKKKRITTMNLGAGYSGGYSEQKDPGDWEIIGEKKDGEISRLKLHLKYDNGEEETKYLVFEKGHVTLDGTKYSWYRL